MFKYKTLILLLCAFCYLTSYSQITLTGSSIESRCQSSGSITINASGGSSPYLYEIISGPVTRPQQSPNVFNGLQAGSYTVRVTDNLSATNTIVQTVDGNYVLPSATFTPQEESCLGNDGQITINASGRFPFSYELVAPSPVIVGPQTSNLFTGLVAGNYDIRITDSCGNFITQGYTLGTRDYTPIKPISFTVVSFDCDSIDFRLGLANPSDQDWQDSLRIFIMDYNDNTDTVMTTRIAPTIGYYDTIRLSRHKYYRIDGYDTCGNFNSRSGGVNYGASIGPFSFSCDGFYAFTGYGSGMIDSNTSYQIISGPVTTGVQYDQDFDSLPYGTYTIRVCDTLCDTCIVSSPRTPTPFRINAVVEAGAVCDTGLATLLIVPSDDATNGQAIVLSAPPTYPNLLPDTFAITSNNFSLSNTVGGGTYIISISDSCGRIDTVTRAVVGAKFTSNITYSIGCNSLYSINVNGYRTTPRGTVILRDSNNNILQSTNLGGGNYNHTFPNINLPGTYYLHP